MGARKKTVSKKPAAHTPEPWTLEDRDTRILIWSDRAHDFIAQLSTEAEGADDDAAEAFAEEQWANAAVMVTAPQTLAQLEKAVAWVKEYFGPGDDLNGVRWLKDAERIIADARGIE